MLVYNNEFFKEFVQSLCKKYNQDSAVIRYVGDNMVYLTFKNSEDSDFPIGKFKAKKLEDFYSQTKDGRYFVFQDEE